MIENNDLKVTIVIPTHNDAETLPRAIDSALTQSHEALEILVIDDASDNDVSAFLSEKYPQDERLRVLRHETNKMLGGARNTGILAATGDYILFLDADDRLFPDAIRELLSAAAANDADVVQGATLIGEDEAELRPYHAYEFVSGGGIDGLRLFSIHNYASIACAKLYKRSFLISSGITFAERYMHEDVAFSAQTAFRAKRLVSISNSVLHYILKPSSLTQRRPTRFNIESYFETYVCLIRLLHEFGIGNGSNRDLFVQILSAHGGADFGPKLSNCHLKMGHEAFREALLSVAEHHFGDYGLAFADLITALISAAESPSAELAPISHKVDMLGETLVVQQACVAKLLAAQEKFASDQRELLYRVQSAPDVRAIAREVWFEYQRRGLGYKISRWFKKRLKT